MLQYLKESNADKGFLKTQISEQIDADLRILDLLMPRLNDLSSSTWSCKTNKLPLIMQETKRFFAKNADLIIEGRLPESMKYYWSKPRWMDASNIQELALKASLVLAYGKLNKTIDLDTSALLHSTPLPLELNMNLERLSFFYNQTQLSFVHGGYAFGGQRQDSYYLRYGPFGKQFGPQDCSSWVSKLIGSTQAFSTSDFAEYKNFEIQKLVKPVRVNSLEDIEPGMIWVTLRFNSGHVNIVVRVDLEVGSILVIEYARDLPNYEGFGFRIVSWNERPRNVQDFWFVVPFRKHKIENL
ncbi:MAG: hypothetical protein WCK49_06250 [Myxococcaceae bacterium]